VTKVPFHFLWARVRRPPDLLNWRRWCSLCREGRCYYANL